MGAWGWSSLFGVCQNERGRLGSRTVCTLPCTMALMVAWGIEGLRRRRGVMVLTDAIARLESVAEPRTVSAVVAYSRAIASVGTSAANTAPTP